MIICVTGPMASGKNFICSQYEKQKEGFVSIDCDKVVHAAVEECREKILETFGETASSMGIKLLNNDGTINRRSLGEVVFSSPELLKKQEDIVYPFVTEKVNQFIKENNDKNVIINATVLYKTPELLAKCEKIIFVKANPVKRFFRVLKRDKMPASKVIERFKSQKNLLIKYKDAVKNIPLEIIKN